MIESIPIKVNAIEYSFDIKDNKTTAIAFRVTALKNTEEQQHSVFEDSKIGKLDKNDEVIIMTLKSMSLSR